VIEGEVEDGKRYTEATSTAPSKSASARIPRRTFMDMIDQREKTIVFCATQSTPASFAT
jgi:type I restriction enzyme R subunit